MTTEAKEENSNSTNNAEKAPLVCSLRLFLAFLAFLGFFICYAQRNGIAVAIICMYDPRVDHTPNSNNMSAIPSHIPHECHKHTAKSNITDNQILQWPKSQRGLALGSFYWGYAATQIAASIVVNVLGPKRFLAILLATSSVSTLLIPWVARWHVGFVVALRVISGAAQGGLWPTIFRFWATWAPASERTTLLSFQSSGPSMGTIVSLIMGGLFCKFSFSDSLPSMFRFGWAYFYYVLGGMGIIWSVVWYMFASDTPVTSTRISEKEKKYIQACKVAEKIQDTHTKTPWGPMLKSQGFWCIVISMFFCDFGLYAIWTVVPEYMNEVLLFSFEENGLLSALPHLGSFIVVMLTGGLADFIIRKGYLKRVNARKVFHGIGTLAPAICLLAISFLDCRSRYLAVFLLVVGVSLNGFMMSGGYVVNVGDFSGVHSGVLFGISNTVSSVGGFIAPYLTSLITYHKTAGEWKLAFTIYACAFLISAVVFSLFARGETEPWARDDAHDEKVNYDLDANKELMEVKATNGSTKEVVA